MCDVEKDVAITVVTKIEHQVQSGDLMAWNYNGSRGWARLVKKFIQFMTLSTYSHVGIAIVKDDILHVLEAVEPTISINPVDANDSYYVVPMNITDTTDLELIMKDYVGKKYSIFDCVRAYLGLHVNDNHRWQCAELATEVYKRLGFDIEPNRLTPEEVINAALIYGSSSVGLWFHKPREKT